MYPLFFICALGLVAVTPLHFLSVEHVKLEAKYGKEKGAKIGEICSYISGWGFFLFWIGTWVSPQPRFSIPAFQNQLFSIPFADLAVPMLHLVVFVPLFAVGAWLGVKGVSGTTLKVAETHRTERIITTGVYSIVRHPQYFGGLLAHMGITFLLSAWYSLLSTPLMIALIFLMSRKEEEELIREFGKEYEDYRKSVPMIVPRILARQNRKNC
jgi:protein-S-isoprenylcysteine O-methyltransferase Ste14